VRKAREYDLTTLPGGERVISEHNGTVRSVALALWVGAGSRDEPTSKAGVSHFIEHLLFRGSSRYTALDIAEIFDELGGELNAATSRETTLLYTRVTDEHLERALDVMADMVFEPTFADLDAEREVVLEEIAMLDDNPHELVHDLASEALFGSHPLGRPVIGRADVIRTIGRRSIERYHGSAYASENVVLAAAGNVAHERLVELLATRRDGTRSVGDLTRRGAGRRPAPSTRFLRRSTEQYHVCLVGPGITHNDDRRYAAAILDAILGGSASSRLFQEIREKRGMAYSVYTFGGQYRDTGLVGLYVGTREENLSECLDVAAHELAEVGAGRLVPAEVERAKENLKARLLLSLESMSSRMNRLGRALVTDVELVSVDETVRRLEAVTPEQVAALAAELYAPERLSAAGIGPSEKLFARAVARVNPGLRAAA
jgi:predicted Zn-dependent peptidase